MVVKDTNISQKMKNKNWLSIEKILQNEKNCFIITIRNFFPYKRMFFSSELGKVR